MAKVISTLFISADGVAEIDPDWHFPYFDENMGRAVGEDYDTADVLLIGRETYDSFAGAWPGRFAASAAGRAALIRIRKRMADRRRSRTRPDLNNLGSHPAGPGIEFGSNGPRYRIDA